MAQKQDNKNSRDEIVERVSSNDVSEQIQRALEMMKRVRTVNAEQAEKALTESDGNRYVLPEPVVFHVS